MATLDRKLQRSILNNLAAAYPGMARLRASAGETEDDLDANIYYLAEHGLVTVPSNLIMSGKRSLGTPSITAAGMDFLADDGGLSAILGVVTVKLHDDTIRKLLIERVDKADGDPSVKASLVAKIKELPAEALGAVTTAGLDQALQQVPNLIGLLRTILHV